MSDDWGYFGKGDTGYAHYMQAFNESNGGSGGGGGGGKPPKKPPKQDDDLRGCCRIVLTFAIVVGVIVGFFYAFR